MVWRATDPQGNESAKCKYDVVPYTRGIGLDIGCGPFKAFPHFIGVDNCHHARQFGWQIKPDVHVDTGEALPMFASGSMDFIFSSHMLEHFSFDSVPKALNEWMRVLKSGGYLILYVPDEDEYPKCGQPGANPDHKWNVNYNKVVDAMASVDYGWDLIEFQKRNQGFEYSLYFVFKKL